MAKKTTQRAAARKMAAKPAAPKKTYTVGFDCTNCFNKFDAEFEFGTPAVTAECPQCGCDTSARRQSVKSTPALPPEPTSEPIKTPPWVKRSPPPFVPWRNPFEEGPGLPGKPYPGGRYPGGIEPIYLFETPRTDTEQREIDERTKAELRELGERYQAAGDPPQMLSFLVLR